MPKIVNLVETRQNPEAALREVLGQIERGELKVERCVLVLETTDEELEFFASGPRSDLTSCVGMLATATTRLAMRDT